MMNYLVIITLVVVALTNCCSFTKADPSLKIRSSKVANGELAFLNEFPFIVSLQQATDETASTGYGHVCGATILNSKYLLSAGHCFHTAASFPWIAVYGGNSVTDSKRKYVKVKSFIIHSKYVEKDGVANYDIALVELESEMILDGVFAKAALLETRRTSTNFNAIVAGWGYTYDDLKTDPTQPSELMKVTVPIVDMSYCDSLGASSPDQICAGDGKGHDSCQGDSGGPLFYKASGSSNDYIVLGIVSYGPAGCGTTASLSNRGIYTNVTSYLNFIESTTTYRVGGAVGIHSGFLPTIIVSALILCMMIL